MKQNFLIVKINCKPLVKTYLERNYGDPVTIPSDTLLYKFACAQLFKENTRLNRHKDYSQHTNFTICRETFRYDGYDINDMNTKTFNTGVLSYIRDSWRNSLDGHLSALNRHIDWKRKYFELVDFGLKIPNGPQDLAKELRRLRREVEAFEMDIKSAIETVVFDTLGLDFDCLPYETVKKDWYRYRLKKAEKMLSANVLRPS